MIVSGCGQWFELPSVFLTLLVGWLK